MNDAMIRLIFLSHAAATLYMTGLIWFVQIVHYTVFYPDVNRYSTVRGYRTER